MKRRAKMENLLSLYSRAHVGFSKRCCPMAEKEDSALKLLIGLQERANVQYLKPFFRSIFFRNEAHWPALASQSEALKLNLPFLP